MPAFRATTVRALAGAFFLSVVPARAHAQFGDFDKIFEAFSDVSVWWGPFYPIHSDITPQRKSGNRWLGSYGAEFLFELSRSPRAGWGVGMTCPTTPARIEKHETRRGDTTVVVEHVFPATTDCSAATHFMVVEVGVGYGQTTRFVIQEVGHEISALIREVPSVSVYASLEPTDKCTARCAFTPYIGLRTGVTQLVDPILTVGAETFSDDAAKSLQLGLVAGIARQLPVFHMFTAFAEAGRLIRPFPTLNWKKGEMRPAGGVRTGLDLSGWALAFGLQFQVRKPEK